MLERIDYIVRNNKAMIYRCYGEGTIVELPGVIAGLPVTDLLDHCFAREASYRYKPAEIKTIYRSQWEAGEVAGENGIREEFPVFSSQIEEVYLPENLVAIDDYAFYGCPNLHIIHIPTTLKRFSGQTFVATHHINCFYFTVEDETSTPPMLKEFLKELPDKLDIIFEDRNGRKIYEIYYPDYYEESRENTPARLFDLVFHGTGYIYRQCFSGKEIDYKKYDATFHLAAAQEYTPDIFKMCYDRMMYPRAFSEEAKEEYLAWLRVEYKALGGWIFDEHREEFIQLLGQYGYFTEELLDWFMRLASEKQRAEIVGYLMEYRRSHFGKKKKKKYEF